MEHVPLVHHMLGIAIKAITQVSFGDYFEDDEKVADFHRDFDTVSMLN